MHPQTSQGIWATSRQKRTMFPDEAMHVSSDSTYKVSRGKEFEATTSQSFNLSGKYHFISPFVHMKHRRHPNNTQARAAKYHSQDSEKPNGS